MPKYTINVEITLHNEDGENRGQIQREYSLADVTGITEAIAHAGRTAALHFEGVEKLDMTE